MKRSAIVASFSASLALLVLAGCDHKVALTFVNTTPQTRDVEVDVPGQGAMFVGTLPSGAKRHTNIKISKDELPATVGWSAGEIHDRFTVDQNVKDRVIYIEPAGSTTLDKKTEVHRKAQQELAPRKVEERQVVE